MLAADPDWVAPLLWRSEFRNVLTLLARREALSFDRAIEAAELAETLMAGAEFAVGSGPVLELARASGCSAYDCEFVALARQERAPLLTTDRQILVAFPRVAITPEKFLEVS